MKKIRLFTFLSLFCTVFFLGSCNNDDEEVEGLKLEAHDSNKMMTIMHEMMAQMMNSQMTAGPDHMYAMMMPMHHEGAIKMAEEEIANGTNAEMKAIAQRMKAAQEVEIQQFNAMLATIPTGTPDAEYNKKDKAAMDKMMRDKDLRVITGNTDHDFAQLMIPHHQSAIEMSYALLEHGSDPALKNMARKIIEDQNKELEELQTWLLVNKGY
ncbi:DUF305 domain-containing protein [Adhaeribacter sp. BT258]|uniref:DUF305 domain-containing protein n=1 Tax=Adhaeribacter terrigena TaxID=2793070 RepID=A0ABS1BXI6_9BACT|nr:DUF305 domain-containing protein [Adhaeribacter terrigena]MBK0401863.1 DUF305 domain-containing protein [Adhaeribacter terrigena]